MSTVIIILRKHFLNVKTKRKMNSYIKSIELKCISLDASNNFSLDQDTITRLKVTQLME